MRTPLGDGSLEAARQEPIYSVVVSSSDAFLKPLLLGRGLDVPMPVILIGAIGGMLLAGIVGLFVGAVILVLGYELVKLWVEQDFEPGGSKEEPS